MATYSWADLINSAPEQEQAPLSLWDLARKKQDELGLTPGMEGTTTIYTGPQLPFGSPNMSLSPFEGANAHTFYTPPEGAFVSPLEGMERLYRQALGGNVQEEYVNPAFSGATGKDTTNFDWLAGLDPYKKDWGLSDSAYFEQKQGDGFLGMLKEMAPGLAILGGGLGLVAGGPALFGSGAAAAAGGEAAAGAAGGTGYGVGMAPSIASEATGLASLPAAGTWSHTTVPALGASAGEWTLPAALAPEGSLGMPMANELIYSDIGPAQGSILSPGAQESGAFVSPVDANPYAGITAKPTGTIWDKAKEILEKKPPLPGGGGGAQMEGGGGGEGMSIWSDTVNPYQFDPVGAYQPKYLQMQQQQFPFEAELQRRLALIRGAQ